jgi:hypothetical protein
MLMQARNEARYIARVKMMPSLRWLNMSTTPIEGTRATIVEWQEYLRATGERCPHPSSLAWVTRNSPGGCLVCGMCYHRVINRENAGTYDEVQWCDDCGEERDVRYRGF